MSDASLYVGLYQQLREYANLVDDVLVGLKAGTSSPDDRTRQELGNLLINLARDRWDDLSTRLILLSLRDCGGVTSAEWSSAGSALLSSEVSSSVVDVLERLARLLEQEQVAATARMQVGLR